MLKGGVIMDVVNVEEARIAEEAGAVAVMALERVPADIRKDGGIARMSDPEVRAGRIAGRGARQLGAQTPPPPARLHPPPLALALARSLLLPAHPLPALSPPRPARR